MTKANKLDQEIGKKIRVNRIAKKKTRTWLCGEINKSYQQFQKYEKGKNRISGSALYLISGLLETPIEKFFPDKGEENKKDS